MRRRTLQIGLLIFLLVGLLVSLPDAIVTKAYAPILVVGLLFGAIGGWIAGRWGSPA